MTLKIPVQGRRNFTGVLQGFADENILIEVDGEEYELPFSRLVKARLIA